MLSACNQHGDVLATEVSLEDGPFHCSACREPVILKKGRVVVSHFAHLPDADCASTGEGESEAHRLAKLEIYQALLRAPGVTSVWVERYLREVRPDISFVLNGERVAIEIQISMLSRDGIDWRTTAYAKKDIAVLWMPLLSSEVFADRYAPKDWERYLHTLYFGKVYYWAEHTCSRHPIRLLALRRGKKDCEEAPCSQVKRGFLNALAKHVSELEGTAKAVLFVPVSHLFPATGGGQYVYRMS